MTASEKKSSDTNAKLVRLLLIIGVTVVFAVYSYGWQVTEIDLDKPQDEKRQENVTNSLQQLLSPRIFEQEYVIVAAEANFRLNCDGNPVEQPSSDDIGSIQISPDCGVTGDIVNVEVSGFDPASQARIRWNPPDGGQARPREILEIEREDFVLNNSGGFTGTIEVPRIRGSEDQVHQVTVLVAIPEGNPQLSDTSEIVIRAMIETIFMALLATSVAIPIAAVLSFFAAKNLMRPIRLTLGGLLVTFVGFAIGWVFLGPLLTPIGQLGINIGKGDALTVVGAILVPVAIVALMIFGLRLLNDPKRKSDDSAVTKVRSTGTKIVVVIVLLFLLGNIGGLAILVNTGMQGIAETIRPSELQALLDENKDLPGLNLQEWIPNAIADAFSAIGNLFDILGTLTELFMPIIAAAAGAYLLSTISNDWLSMHIRRANPVVGHILTGILGMVAGAILLGVTGVFGTWASLPGLITPIIAAILGGGIGVLLFQRIVYRGERRRRFEMSRSEVLARSVTFAVSAIVVFVLTMNYLNVNRALVTGILPPPDTTTFLGVEISVYVLQNALVGAILGGVAGLLAGASVTFPIGSTLYNVSRTCLNSVRSIEPLIMGLVFVIWVGIGPFAGVLALTLHSIAALGKLYSEQIENIDEGPIEAIQSTGASWIQTVIYAVVPQIVPPYIAFTMYRWDINVRMSTIIGFVGGGGIGLLLQQQINLLQYRDAGVAVLAIAIVVSILDYMSATIRERLI